MKKTRGWEWAVGRDEVWGKSEDQIKPGILMVNIVMVGLEGQDMEIGSWDDVLWVFRPQRFQTGEVVCSCELVSYT